MTGQEWQDKFEAEHGRAPKREEYRAAAATNFAETDLPVVAEPVKVRTKKGVYIVLAMLGAALLGGAAYAFKNGSTDTPAPTTHMSSSAATTKSSEKTSVSSSSESTSSASSASSSESTPNVVATDLTRADRAYIIAAYMVADGATSIDEVKGINSNIVDGAGSGKGSVHLQVGVNGIGATYELSGDGGVSVITGSYSAGNGDGVHDFAIDVNDWLKTHNLDEVKAQFANAPYSG